jgi:hypothetical protein
MSPAMSAVMNSFSERQLSVVCSQARYGTLTLVPEVHVRLEHRVEVGLDAQFRTADY